MKLYSLIVGQVGLKVEMEGGNHKTVWGVLDHHLQPLFQGSRWDLLIPRANITINSVQCIIYSGIIVAVFVH